MATNTGVILLCSKTGKGFSRLEIEDNIGEGIHIHYKNLRLDYTVEEFLNFSQSCRESLEKLGFEYEEDDK